MEFNSLVFLFAFLPISLLLYAVTGKKLRIPVLFILSLVFYAWAGVSYSLIFIGIIIVNYFFGKALGGMKDGRKRNAVLWISVLINILLLAYFKYLNFLLTDLNAIIGTMGAKPVSVRESIVPLGLSFITFFNISYLLDIHRSKSSAEKSFLKFGLSSTFFPKVVSGPIARHSDIVSDLYAPAFNWNSMADGIKRFILGLVKKVIVADLFASIADQVFSASSQQQTFVLLWFGIICFTLQIYVDFSAYSDMAIGLGRMFGIRIPENFDLPYTSKSLTEFWRRWHMTLSSWLRDYLFVPLSIRLRHYGRFAVFSSLFVTFIICGLWHGAGWTFITWGFINGLVLAIESAGFLNFLKKLWTPLRHIYLMLIIMFGWIFFKSDYMHDALGFIKTMFSFRIENKDFLPLLSYMDKEFILILILAILGSAGVFSWAGKKISRKFSHLLVNPVLNTTYTLFEVLAVIIAMTTVVSYLSASSYHPFIYFRF